MNVTAVLAQLESAQLGRLLVEGDPAFVFKHALVQDAAYASLLKQERKRLHHSIAAVMEEEFADQLDQQAARIAEHYVESEDWKRAADFSLRAGNDALRVYALRDALTQFQRAQGALAQLPDPEPTKLVDAILGWAQAALRFHSYVEQLDRLARAEEIARRLNDKPRLARTLYALGRLHLALGYNLNSVAPLTECFALAGELGDERATIIPTFSMGMATYEENPQRAIAFFEQAAELARRYEDVDTEAISWSARAMVHARMGDMIEARDALARALALVDRMKSPMAKSDMYLFAGWACLDMGDPEKGLEYGQLGLDTATSAHNMHCICAGYDCVGFNRLAEQDLPHAIEAFREAIRRSQFSGAHPFENLGRAGLAMAEYYSGRQDARDDMEQVWREAQIVGNQFSRALMGETLGEIFLRAGDFERARVYLSDALDYFERTGIRPHRDRVLDLCRQLDTQHTTAADKPVL